jgi:hypothetical protein
MSNERILVVDEKSREISNSFTTCLSGPDSARIKSENGIRNT